MTARQLSGNAVRRLVAPTPEAFREALDACRGVLREVGVHLGLGNSNVRMHYLMKREPELYRVHREWLAANGRRFGSWPLQGTMVPDAEMARIIDDSTTVREAARRIGYRPAALWKVARRHPDCPLTAAAYTRLRERMRWNDPRDALVRSGTDALRAAIPAHGRWTRDEWRAIAREVGATRRHLWPDLSNRRSITRTPGTVSALLELATVMPEMSAASLGIGATSWWVAFTAREHPEVGVAFAQAYTKAMALSKAEHRRRDRRDWWDERFSSDIRRQRAAILDEVARVHGTIAAYERDAVDPKFSRSTLEHWMRADQSLYREGLYPLRPLRPNRTPVVSREQLREPALIMRHVASGDRWWQWGKLVAWVGDRDHSARLMLAQAATGVERMTRRLERVNEELWARDGWEADSRMARWDDAIGDAVWRPW